MPNGLEQPREPRATKTLELKLKESKCKAFWR